MAFIVLTGKAIGQLANDFIEFINWTIVGIVICAIIIVLSLVVLNEDYHDE